MEFIKNIFEKIKNFFTIHERVRMLEIQQKALDSSVTALHKRIEMLEFKTKGMTYYCYKLYTGAARAHWVVEYTRSTHVARVHLYNETGIREPEINDDYLEFYENGKIARVYVALDNDDALVDVDLDLYKKAYPERFETPKGDGWVTVSTGNGTITTTTKPATTSISVLGEALGEVKKAVDDLKKTTAKPKKKTTKKENTK